MTSPTPPSPPSLDPPAAGWPPPPPPPGGPVRPALRRSSTDKVVGGVAGGLAEYTGIDPLLWRVGFIALTVAGGSGVLVYALLWLLLPGDRGRGHAPAGEGTVAHRTGPRSPVPGITVAGILVVVGVLVLLTRYTGLDLGPRGFLGAALLVVGAGLVVAAFTGGRGARAGLVVLGLVLALALGAASTTSLRNVAGNGVGDRTYVPVTVADVQPEYRGGVGDMTVDLTRVPLSGLGGPITTRIAHGVGDVEVLVPASADVDVRVSQGIGSVDALDLPGSDGGFSAGTGTAPWTGDNRPEFVITIDGGIGDVEVARA